MAKRKQQETELEASMHGITLKKTSGFQPGPAGQPDSTGSQTLPSDLGKNLDQQLRHGIMKGLPIKIVDKRKK